MAQTIAGFLSGFNGGTRLNRFTVEGSIDSQGTNTSQTFTEGAAKNMSHFHIRSASLPESIFGELAINYRGRTVSFPGDRIYKPWNITVLDDVNSRTLHKDFHDWSNKINDHLTNLNNVSGGELTLSNNFATNWQVKQYDTDGAAVIKTIDIKNCWPTAVGPIQLDMGQDNTFCSFAVSMLFTHAEFTIKDPSS